MSKKTIALVYDKQCPVCANYCQIVQIRESVGEMMLIDARKDSQHLQQITKKGLAIDQGMVLIVDDNLFYGADAIHALALMSSRSGLFNKLNYWLFKSPDFAKIVYPILRFCRSILLKYLGKAKINNLKVSANDRF